MTDRIEEIRRLQELRNQGALTEEEFTRAKGMLLDALGSDDLHQVQRGPSLPKGPKEARDLTVWLHLSVLAGLVVPLAGYVVPVVLWQVNKQDPTIDAHGKSVANWLVSSLIYAVVSGILTCVVIGVIPLIGVIILNIVYPIVGAVRASRGELWPYPLSIKIFK